ncbi:MAG: hypothetical protein IPP48_03225 [Chitinophagaceae bacterium]|nr:hypothetical protein [Chitinophagaceae bacterium]
MKKRFLKWKAYWFTTKKIVHTTTHQPGEFVEFKQAIDGSKWARVIITNRQPKKEVNLLTDIKFENVIRVDVIPCRFIQQLYKKFGWKIKYRQLNIVK